MASAFCVPFRKSLPISLHEEILLCFCLEVFPVVIMGIVKFYFLHFIFSFLFDVGVRLPQHHLLQDHLLPSSLLCPLLHKSSVICGWVFCWIFFLFQFSTSLSLCQYHHLNCNSFRTSLDIQ